MRRCGRTATDRRPSNGSGSRNRAAASNDRWGFPRCGTAWCRPRCCTCWNRFSTSRFRNRAMASDTAGDVITPWSGWRSCSRAGYVHVVDADLKSYFDTIPKLRLMARVREKVSDSRVLRMVEMFLRTRGDGRSARVDARNRHAARCRGHETDAQQRTRVPRQDPMNRVTTSTLQTRPRASRGREATPPPEPAPRARSDAAFSLPGHGSSRASRTAPALPAGVWKGATCSPPTGQSRCRKSGRS